MSASSLGRNGQPLAPKLRELLEMRQRLVDLLTKLDGNEDLQGQLQKLLGDKEKFGAVKALAAKSATAN